MSLLRLALVVLIAGCSAVAPEPMLSGRTYVSTAVTEAGADRALVPGTRIRLDFGSDGRIGGDAGCNSFGGPFQVVDGRLEVRDAAMTAMGCDAARHAQDEWLLTFLTSRPAVALEGEGLVLTSGDTVIRLVDEEAVRPDQPLVGPTWTVTSLISGDAVSSVPDDLRATLQFAADGTFAVNTGCNVGQGRVEGDGTTLRFVDLVLTKRACLEEGGRLESAVLSVLEADSVTVTIDASTLTLQAGDSGLVLAAS